ncbi:hypothetical protein D3C87_1548890 [compost metagenome]
MVGRADRRFGVARLAVDEPKRVMTQREVRAQIHRAAQLRQRLILLAAQPQRPAHGPMRGRVAIIGDQTLPGCFKGQVDGGRLLAPALERILPMGERQARIRP